MIQETPTRKLKKESLALRLLEEKVKHGFDKSYKNL